MVERADGRLANVAGAVIPGADAGPPAAGEARAAARIARRLAMLFEEVICVGSEPPADTGARRADEVDGPPSVLRDIGSALAAATAERVRAIQREIVECSNERIMDCYDKEDRGRGFVASRDFRTREEIQVPLVTLQVEKTLLYNQD